MIYTLQEYMTKTEGVTYILMLLFLVAFILFWKFLTGRDEETMDADHFSQQQNSAREFHHHKQGK